jgi:hypothetical protein
MFAFVEYFALLDENLSETTQLAFTKGNLRTLPGRPVIGVRRLGLPEYTANG